MPHRGSRTEVTLPTSRPPASASPVRRLRDLLLVSLLLVAPAGATAQDVDLDRLRDEAVQRTQEYLRVNTVNPPGNEIRGVEYFAGIFDEAGIPWDSVSSAEGRGNIWATIEGGDEPALVLLHHMDVVPSDEEFWEVDPLSGVIRDGYIWGRGALDTKGLGIAHLQAFLALHRSGLTPDRDVIFMGTADEEAGGFYGAGWLVENRPELFRDVGWLLNEGGGGSVSDGEVSYGVEVTQKVPIWLELTAEGEPGHGSRPLMMSAVNRLVRALYRIQTYESEPRIVPAVDRYFEGLAGSMGPEWADRLRDIEETVRDPEHVQELQIEHPGLHALVRNTCSLTMLEGSSKINVVPPSASARIDCRMLPDQDPDEFQALLETVVNDPNVRFERIMAFSPAVSSIDTELYRTLEEVSLAHHPDAAFIPSVSTGFTDSHFFRDLGITSYGWSPFVVPEAHSQGVHGNNERVSVENVREGAVMMWEVLRSAVAR